MTQIKQIAVLGGGHLPRAMAGALALKGHSVNLFSRYPEEIAPIKERGGIELEGLIEGFGRLNIVTGEIEKAIKDVDLVWISVPAFAHRYMAELTASHLRDGQIVVLHPGHAFGALEFANALKENRVKTKVIVAETETSIYGARIAGPTSVRVFLSYDNVHVASFPSKSTPEVFAILSDLFKGGFTAVENVLVTSLGDRAYVYHVPNFIFNFSRIEKGEVWSFPHGITPMIASFLEMMDSERLLVAAALGVKVPSIKDFILESRQVSAKTLYEAIRLAYTYPVEGPKNPQHRFILEDVPYIMVPHLSLGRMFNVSTPTIDAVVQLASKLYQTDFMKEGRTVEKLGLVGLDADQIKELVTEGIL